MRYTMKFSQAEAITSQKANAINTVYARKYIHFSATKFRT